MKLSDFDLQRGDWCLTLQVDDKTEKYWEEVKEIRHNLIEFYDGYTSYSIHEIEVEAVVRPNFIMRDRLDDVKNYGHAYNLTFTKLQPRTSEKKESLWDKVKPRGGECQYTARQFEIICQEIDLLKERLKD